jgi:lipoprotein-releasing system permease protein
VFEVGVYDYDKAFVVMPMQNAQTAAPARRYGRHDRGEDGDPDKVGDILAPLADKVAGKAVVTDWRQMNAAVRGACRWSASSMFVVLSLIMLVAVFNILSSLIMLVRAKTRDIAILRTMGASGGEA